MSNPEKMADTIERAAALIRSQEKEITGIKAALSHLREAAGVVAQGFPDHPGVCRCANCVLDHALAATCGWDKK